MFKERCETMQRRYNSQYFTPELNEQIYDLIVAHPYGLDQIPANWINMSTWFYLKVDSAHHELKNDHTVNLKVAKPVPQRTIYTLNLDGPIPANIQDAFIFTLCFERDTKEAYELFSEFMEQIVTYDQYLTLFGEAFDKYIDPRHLAYMKDNYKALKRKVYVNHIIKGVGEPPETVKAVHLKLELLEKAEKPQ